MVCGHFNSVTAAPPTDRQTRYSSPLDQATRNTDYLDRWSTCHPQAGSDVVIVAASRAEKQKRHKTLAGFVPFEEKVD